MKNFIIKIQFLFTLFLYFLMSIIVTCCKKILEEICMYSGRDCHIKPTIKIYAAFTFKHGGSFVNIGYSCVEY